MKRSKNKDNSFLTGKRGATLIILGSLASVALFFLIAQSVDVFIRTTSQAVPQKRLPFENGPQPMQKSVSKTPSHENAAPPKLSFYKTLVQKEQVHDTLARSKTDTSKKDSQVKAKPEVKRPEEVKKQEKPPEKGTYILQLGAFQKSEKAQSLMNELKQKGYKPYTVVNSIPGKGTLIKVRIGGLTDLLEAQRKASEIERNLKISVLITKQ